MKETPLRRFSLLFMLAGCFNPSLQQGVPCAEGNECPEGQFCAEDGNCYDTGTPDFAVSTSGSRQVFRVPNSGAVEVFLERMNGFEGEVTLELLGLPEGVIAEAATIQPGVSATTIGIDLTDVAPGFDGSITVTGTAENVTRMTTFELLLIGPAGTLDPTFGVDGLATSPPQLSQLVPHDALFLSDGRLLVSGSSAARVFVVAYLPNGNLDPSFGDAGVVLIDASGIGAGIPSLAGGYLALQSDDKIVVTGFGGRTVSGERDVLLARLDANGDFDSTFLNGGIAVHQHGASLDSADIAIGPDNKIITAGTLIQQPDDDMSVLRFEAGGAVDASFAGGFSSHHVNIGVDASSFGRIVAPQTNGGVIVGGSASTGGGNGFAVMVRFTSTGVLDTTFGTNGEVLPGSFNVKSITALDNGDVLVVNENGWQRYEASGALDSAFATDGTLTLPSGITGLTAAALNADQILAASFGSELIRVTTEGEFDQTFGTDGVVIDATAVGSPTAVAFRSAFRAVVVRLSVDFERFTVSQYWN